MKGANSRNSYFNRSRSPLKNGSMGTYNGVNVRDRIVRN